MQKLLTIKADCPIYCLCFFKDGRLISGGDEEIVIYNKHTYKSDIIIYDDEDNIKTICVLENDNLASAGSNGLINIWEIDGNNYKHTHIFKGHNDYIRKLIELEDGKLCSCSDDHTIKIWDNKNNYECFQTLAEDSESVNCIIEMNSYIISSAGDDNSFNVRIWSKSTFKCVKTLENICCWNNNSISKLKDNTIILGDRYEIFTLDILSFKYKTFQSHQLGWIFSICAVRDDKVLIGNSDRKMIYFDLLSCQIIFIKEVHNDFVSCIIKSEENKIFSSSPDKSIIAYNDL